MFVAPLDISKLLTRFGMLFFFKNFSLTTFWLAFQNYFFFFFFGYTLLCVVPNRKCSKKNPINSGILQDSLLGHALSLLYINDIPMLSVIFLFKLMILLPALNMIWLLIC